MEKANGHVSASLDDDQAIFLYKVVPSANSTVKTATPRFSNKKRFVNQHAQKEQHSIAGSGSSGVPIVRLSVLAIETADHVLESACSTHSEPKASVIFKLLA